MQAPRTDLNLALQFVIHRISEQAQREGEPLLEGEREFLRHLPKHPTNPTLHSAYYPGDVAFGMPAVRDFAFERLCSLAKKAYAFDVESNATARRQGDFAAAVLNFYDHPMSWLLRWAGIKLQKAATLTDGCLLVTSGIAVVALMLCIGFAFLHIAQSHQQVPNVALWIAGVSLFLAIVLALHLLTRRLERWQGKRSVEKYRCALDDSAESRV